MEVSRELLHMSDVFDSGSPADLNRLAAVAFWDIPPGIDIITPIRLLHNLEKLTNWVCMP